MVLWIFTGYKTDSCTGFSDLDEELFTGLEKLQQLTSLQLKEFREAYKWKVAVGCLLTKIATCISHN